MDETDELGRLSGCMLDVMVWGWGWWEEIVEEVWRVEEVLDVGGGTEVEVGESVADVWDGFREGSVDVETWAGESNLLKSGSIH